jgi:hypothetical protein
VNLQKRWCGFPCLPGLDILFSGLCAKTILKKETHSAGILNWTAPAVRFRTNAGIPSGIPGKTFIQAVEVVIMMNGHKTKETKEQPLRA